MKIIYITIFTLEILFSINPSNPYYDSSKKHHTKTGFTNPYLAIENQKKGFSALAKMMKENRPSPSKIKNTKIVSLEQIKSLIDKKTNFYIWVGHSTILIHINGKTILTDPIFSERCSPVQFMGPKRYTDPAISLDSLPKIDLVLISHNHYDHLDFNTVKTIGNSATWLVPLGLKKWFNDRNVYSVKELDWYDQIFEMGVKIYCLPSQHWSKRTLLKSFDTLWASWAIENNGFKFWFAGDTGYNNIQFKKIGTEYGPFDLAAIPIGAYEPRWFMKNFHINPAEAVKIHIDIQSKNSIGIHFGTFILTTEPIDDPIKQLNSEILKNNLNPLEFVAPILGQIIFL